MTDTLTSLRDESTRTTSAEAKPTPRWFFVIAAAVLAVVAGAAGAGLSQLAFPAQRGPAGPAGATGATGPAGRNGTDGTVASLDTNKLGYCFSSDYQYSGNQSWISDVQLFAPTSNNGTLSCPSGQFISLTPTGPDGMPIKD